MKSFYLFLIAVLIIPIISHSQPANDSCEGAIELILNGNTEEADNTFSTIVGPEGSCYETGQEVGDTWFMFTLTETTNVRVTTEEGESQNSQVSVFTIDGCGSGNEVYSQVGCNDDASYSNLMSIVNMYYLPAETYYVKAGTYGQSSTGSYTISLQTLPDPPLGSDCADAEVINLELNGIPQSANGSGLNTVDFDGLGAPHKWEAFSISECADVIIDYCNMPISNFGLYGIIATECPAINGEFIYSYDTNNPYCNIGYNPRLNFFQLSAGTYYYPVYTELIDGLLSEYFINFTAVPCSAEPDSCTNYASYPSHAFNTEFGGAPVPDSQGFCETYQLENIEVEASRPYTIDGFAANTSYTFSICEGPNAGSWSPAISVKDPNGVVVAYEENCTVTWITQMSGTYIIGVSEVGACYSSENMAQGNGYPTLSCGGTIGIEEVGNGASFSIYPNPNNGYFTIASAGVSGSYTIELLDLTGRTIHIQTSVLNANSETNVSVKGIASGVYMLRMINTKDNSFTTQRIVVK